MAARALYLIVAQWSHVLTSIWVNIGLGNGLLPYKGSFY